jgi:hypothetical protein
MIFGFLPQNLEGKAVAAAFIMSWHENEGGAHQGMTLLAGSRRELYCSLGTRRDVLFEVADAVLCRLGRVVMLAELCLEPECRRGHGAACGGLNCGEVRVARPLAADIRLPWQQPCPIWPARRPGRRRVYRAGFQGRADLASPHTIPTPQSHPNRLAAVTAGPAGRPTDPQPADSAGASIPRPAPTAYLIPPTTPIATFLLAREVSRSGADFMSSATNWRPCQVKLSPVVLAGAFAPIESGC